MNRYFNKEVSIVLKNIGIGTSARKNKRILDIEIIE